MTLGLNVDTLTLAMLFGFCENLSMHAKNIIFHFHPAGDDAKLLSLAAPEQTQIFVYGQCPNAAI